MKRLFKIFIFICTAGILSIQAAVLLKKTSSFADDKHIDIQYINNEIILITKGENAADTALMLKNNAPVSYTIEDSYNNYCLILADDSSPELLNYFNSSEDILIAEYNSELSITGITNDTYSPAQWPLDNSGAYSYFSKEGYEYLFPSVYDMDMNVLEAWSLNISSPRSVTVAVIDTGVDYMHPDLRNNMWINEEEIPGDGIDNDNNGYIDDIYGWDFYNNDNTICHYGTPDENGNLRHDPEDLDDHGTHCAGIIAASANNAEGIAGVASNINIKIMALKIHGGAKSKGTIANAVKAIKYASYMGADICNLSWGTNIYSEALENTIRESNMLFVAAAGNDGSNIDTAPLYPASFNLSNLISVTFNDADGLPVSDTNFGNAVDISAPGASIFSTVVGGYETMSGSSMAAPHVSGVAAMIYATGYNYFPSEIKQLIISTLKPLPAFEDMIANPGMPDAYEALKQSYTLTSDYNIPQMVITQSYDHENFIINIDSNDFDGSGVRVIKYAPGYKDILAFKHGTAGTSVKGNTTTLTKAGEYTFYISDYAGNESVTYYDVLNDETAPDISAYYLYSSANSVYALNISVTDYESGVKQLKYMPGEHDASDFRLLHSGTALDLDENGNITIYESIPGYYTFYAVDYRGNKSTLKIFVPDILISSISFKNQGLFLTPGQEYSLLAAYEPVEANERIIYHSSHPSVAKVNEHGVVTALTPGFTVISASTGQGLTTECLIFVKYNSSIYKTIQR